MVVYMSKFLEAVKALFPQSRAFELFVENKKYKLIKALCELPENVRKEGELVYFDLFPETTRYPQKWEEIFALYFTEREYEKRRKIIESMWKIIYGGQSAQFLQDVLQCIDPNIRVIENVPVKNPRDNNIAVLSVNCMKNMVCGNRQAINNFRIGDSGFVPSILQNDNSDFYSIPNNPLFWGLCFYIGRGVDRYNNKKIISIKKINIDIKWKNFIEYFILRIKPLHTTAVLYIDWMEDEDDKD